MKKRILYYTLPVLAVAALLTYRLSTSAYGETAKEEASPASASSETTATAVRAKVITPERLESKLFATGTLLPNESVTLAAEVSGKVTAINFEEGQSVGKGQLLLALDDSELQAEREKAQRQIEYLGKKLARDERLKQKGGVSQEAYEQTLRDLQTQRAELDLLDARIEKTRIRAPFDGTIGLRYVSVGSYLSPSTQIAEIVDLTPLKLEFSIPEKYMGKVGKGAKAFFTVAGDEESYCAEVYAVRPSIDTRTRTIALRAVAHNANGRLLPGAFANVEIVLSSIDSALLAPTQAVIPEQGGKKVFLVREGKALPVSIEGGIRTETELQVLEGLQAGDTLVTSGIMSLREGTPVRIIEMEK